MSTSDGYATAAAAVTSLAIALVATAVTSVSVSELRLARADLSRTRAEYGLAGAETAAALTVIQSKQEARLAWTFASDAGAAVALAEPEAAKIDYKTAADLDDGVLARLGVADASALRGRLQALAQDGRASFRALAGADDAPVWKRCAASLISPLGQAPKLAIAAATAPQAGQASWRGGEVWRLKVTAGGWSEDRLVRFTGDVNHPAAVIDQRFYRDGGGQACDALIATS